MVDVRRAYGRWLRRRLLWLVPSLLLSCAVCAELAFDPELPGWLRIPSLALATGVTILFGALAVQTLLVAREKSLGRSRKAQLLRKELGPYPGLSIALLLLLLMLLGVHSLLPEPRLASVPLVQRPAGRAMEPRLRDVSEPTELPVAPALPPERPVAPAPPPDRAPVPEHVSTPQIVPEIVRLPELPLRLEDLEPPARIPVRQESDGGMDHFGMKHRPGLDDDVRTEMADRIRKAFQRAGVPDEHDAESWIPGELRVEVMIVTKSGLWRGAGFGTGVDLPFGRDDSIRLAYATTLLNNGPDIDDLEPSFAWHRGTLEYVRRLAGYTRHATFDLAFRIGMAVDRLGAHEAGVHFDSSFRISPWIGLETAVWEDSGVGLVMQAGHSPATRLMPGSSKVTDLRVVVRIDLGEHSVLEVGYRMLSVRFRDRAGSAEDEYTDKMNRSFMGPIAGLAVRF